MDVLSNTFGLVGLAVAAALIAVDCGKDIRQLVTARNVFILSIIAWYLVEACLLPDELQKYTPAEYSRGILLVLVCIGAFLAVYHNASGGVFDGAFRRLAAIDRPGLLWQVFVAAVVAGFLPLVVVANGNLLLILQDAFMPDQRWASPFQRGRYGGARDAFLELQMFLRAAVPLAAAIMVKVQQSKNQRLIAAAFLVFMFVRAFNSGTRSQVVEVFLPIAAAIYWQMPVERKRNAIRFGIPLLVAVAMYWSAATVVTRNSGDFDLEKAAEAEYVGFEMFRELLYLTRLVPEESAYKYGHTYFVQAVNPIPRFLWPGKPDGDAGLELARLQGSVANGEAYMTTSPGLIGEMYWNFGIFGVIILSAFLGYLAKSWDRIQPLAERSILAFTVFSAGLAIIFLSGRSFNMATLYGMLALFAVLVCFSGTAANVGAPLDSSPSYVPRRSASGEQASAEETRGGGRR